MLCFLSEPTTVTKDESQILGFIFLRQSLDPHRRHGGQQPRRLLHGRSLNRPHSRRRGHLQGIFPLFVYYHL